MMRAVQRLAGTEPPPPPVQGRPDRDSRLAGLAWRRRLLGAMVGAAGLPLLTLALLRGAGHVDLSTALLSYVGLTVLVATIGGIWPSVAVALAGFAAGNWYFTAPFRTWKVDAFHDVLALSVFLTIAVVVSVLVDLAARRAAEAESARAESTALAGLAATVARSDDPLNRLVADLRQTLGLQAAAVLTAESDGWHVLACAGGPCPATPDDGSDTMELEAGTMLVLQGPGTPVDDRRVLAAFAAQLALAIDKQRLEAEAVRAEGLAETDRLRTALLSAVSHDLRTPLATIKAWLTGLLDDDVHFEAEAVRDIVQAAAGEVDRLNSLVGNLLDMSRLRTGVLAVHCQPVEIDAVAAAAVAGLGYREAQVQLDLPDWLPPVSADPALLERVLANLIDNAVRHSPADRACRVSAVVRSRAIDVLVVDHGVGIPLDQRGRVFEPFQRLDDHSGNGVGLGLAVARGLTEAIGAELSIDDTGNGGTSMVLSLQVAG